MGRYGTDWYKARAREKWEREKGRRNGIANAISRDLVELEALKIELLREAREVPGNGGCCVTGHNKTHKGGYGNVGL